MPIFALLGLAKPAGLLMALLAAGAIGFCKVKQIEHRGYERAELKIKTDLAKENAVIAAKHAKERDIALAAQDKAVAALGESRQREAALRENLKSLAQPKTEVQCPADCKL